MIHTNGNHNAVIPTVAGHHFGLVAGFVANAARCAGSSSDGSSKYSDAADSMRLKRGLMLERGKLRQGWSGSGWQGLRTQSLPPKPPVVVPGPVVEVVPAGRSLPAPAWAAMVLSRTLCG